MRATLKIKVEHLSLRHNLDLYNSLQVDKLVRMVAERLEIETISLNDIIADREGYILAYLSNENQEVVNVYWDDFTVYHGKTNVVSTQDYYPFGLTFNSYERTASTPNKYKYNGKELQEETGLYDYGARYFDPAIARFINIDPASDNYQSWTPYHYVMNNPIIFIDPTGMLTELFNENGKKIGVDENGVDGNIAIVTNKKEVKRVKENTKNGTHTESSTLNSTVNLPSAYVRGEMGIAVENANKPNAAAGDNQGGFHEEGGIFGADSDGNEKVIHAQPGQAAQPGQDQYASVDVFSGETATNNLSTVEGTFHTHPSGTNAAGSFDQEPSNFIDNQTGQRIGDIPTAQSQSNPSSVTHVRGNHYVLGTGDNKVRIYNRSGTIATFPLKKFTTIGIKK